MVLASIPEDIEIAQAASLKPIGEIAAGLGLNEDEWEPYGRTKAKLELSALESRADQPDGKLILVTAINPTPAGEGKSTTTVGLGQALNRIGKKAIITLREPSLGPTMGMKGGAAGGGYAQVVPMDDINLHFTGDIHAITSAHNTLSALIDNALYRDQACGMDPRRVSWKRVLDVNDRALRQIVVGLGGVTRGIPREDGFDITVASEIMAILCLASDLQDLKQRLARMVVGYTKDKEPVTVGDLKVQGALTLLLKDAIKPNLVQTLENTPAIIHGGPFANIAHGTNSLLATRTARKLADYTITEAGFGADLGAEKFVNIVCRQGGLQPSGAVVVATVRALKMHGGVDKKDLNTPNLEALKRGVENLAKHCENVTSFGLPLVVAINRFPTDSQEELDFLLNWCEEHGHPAAISEVFERGGEGGEELARKLVQAVETNENPQLEFSYSDDQTLAEKIEAVAQKVYGADGVDFSSTARRQIRDFSARGWDKLPVCMAKTQYSLSDNASLLGRPSGFTISVRELRPSIGAGFIVALTGNVLTMPGLPSVPAAMEMDVLPDGSIKGLF